MMIKKMVKIFTFWFALLGVVIVVFNLLNFDDMNIVMIGLNPILNILSSSSFRPTTPYIWYILSLITMTLYGLVLDALKSAFKNNK